MKVYLEIVIIKMIITKLIMKVQLKTKTKFKYTRNPKDVHFTYIFEFFNENFDPQSFIPSK